MPPQAGCVPGKMFSQSLVCFQLSSPHTTLPMWCGHQTTQLVSLED